MLTIAICDDNQEELAHLSSLLDEYRNEHKIPIKLCKFQSATELLSIANTMSFDIIFLDIMMPVLSGIQTAHEIREFDQRVQLVFLTYSPEYAVESYDVKAHNYLIKPITKTMLTQTMNQLLKDIKLMDDSLTIRTKSSILHLPYDRIEYIEINSKVLYFSLIDGTIHEISATLCEYEKLFLEKNFIKVHRSYVVNMLWIQELAPKKITTLCGKQIPVARSVYSIVRRTYLNFLCQSNPLQSSS